MNKGFEEIKEKFYTLEYDLILVIITLSTTNNSTKQFFKQLPKSKPKMLDFNYMLQ